MTSGSGSGSLSLIPFAKGVFTAPLLCTARLFCVFESGCHGRFTMDITAQQHLSYINIKPEIKMDVPASGLFFGLPCILIYTAALNCYI